MAKNTGKNTEGLFVLRMDTLSQAHTIVLSFLRSFPALLFLPLLCSPFYSSFSSTPPFALPTPLPPLFFENKTSMPFFKNKGDNFRNLALWKVRIPPICLLCKGRWPNPSIPGLFHSVDHSAEDGCTEKVWKTGMTEKRQDEFGVVTTCTVVTCAPG